MEGISEGSGALQDTVRSLFPGPSSSPTGPRLGEQEGPPGKDLNPPPTSLVTTTPLSLD